MTDRFQLMELMRRHGLRTAKSLGQHFLVDEDILSGIAHSLELDAQSTVVEIGAGPASLTVMLGLSGSRVTGLELDRKFEPLHNEIRLTRPDFADRLHFNYVDALEFNYAAAAREAHEAGRKFFIVGNIPYQITSPLIMRILESGAAFDGMVLMMQREVAERLAAAPGSRKNGSITIKVQYYCDVENLIDVPPDAFLPPPEVQSQVLRFRRKDDAQLEGKPAFFSLVDAAFMHRRKTLPNALGAAGYARGDAERALQEMQLLPTTRAEQLGLEQFQELAQRLKPNAASQEPA